MESENRSLQEEMERMRVQSSENEELHAELQVKANRMEDEKEAIENEYKQLASNIHSLESELEGALKE